MKHSLFISPLIIFIAVLVLFITNFSSSTQLSGWDNLHPEFNFGLNIERSIFAVWQEYQGLGLVGGMGHASDLPRQLLLLIPSFVLPANYLRQLYFFLMLLLGPLGVYFLLQKVIVKQKLASLLGGLFYLFNLATIQTFYAPFEPFVTQYGALPWLFLTALNYLNHSSKRNLLLLTVVNLLAVPQSYVPTTFLVYLVALIGSLTIISMQHKGQTIKKSLIVLLLTLLVNAFWLVPFLYFVAHNINVSVEAKMNQMATEVVHLQNVEFGNIADVVVLKGFWFSLKDFNTTQQLDYLMSPWREYMSSGAVLAVGFILFAVVLLGIIASFKQKNQYRWILLFLFLAPVTILASNTPPFSWIDNFFYRFSYFAEALRSPFTKFSVLAAFSYSIFFAFGITLILHFLKSKYMKIIMLLIGGGLLIVFTFPILQGNLFYKQIRTNIPQDYYKVWDFFKGQNPNTRIAGFPAQTFFGWTYDRWGYSGSGFLWYGLPQPILDRAFDVWSKTNENYYWEISYALYSNNRDALYQNNRELFEKVLQKYQVSWILVDNSVIYPLSPKSLYINELKQLISSSDKISLAQQFGQVEIYQTNFDVKANNFVYLAENLPKIGPEYKWNNFDQAYLENGDYVSGGLTKEADIYYPFRSMFTGKTQKDIEFSVEDKGSYFIFRKTLPLGMQNYKLKIPDMSKEDTLYFDGQVVEVKVPKIKDMYSVEIDPGETREFWLPDLTHDRGYIIKVDSSNIAGKPLNFWIGNVDLRKADLETYLPARSGVSFYIQPPMDQYGLGYSLHFDQGAFDDYQSKNILGKIEVYPIPFNFLTSLKLTTQDNLIPSRILPVEVSHSTPWLYRVDLPQNMNSSSKTLVLSQSFDPGWQAWVYPGKFPLQHLDKHVLVNNWANGWEILPNQKGTVIIFFWPQLLEWGGFILLIGTFAFLIFKKSRN